MSTKLHQIGQGKGENQRNPHTCPICFHMLWSPAWRRQSQWCSSPDVQVYRCVGVQRCRGSSIDVGVPNAHFLGTCSCLQCGSRRTNLSSPPLLFLQVHLPIQGHCAEVPSHRTAHLSTSSLRGMGAVSRSASSCQPCRRTAAAVRGVFPGGVQRTCPWNLQIR